MNENIIDNILLLLNRVTLQGNEVPAYVECVKYLQNLKDEYKKIEEKKIDI